ncbi:MAG: TlyA family RNA methyltransferase [Clostridiales bacterium]|nr:TlyA family RNA methyltransferase [Clostridiales bacterium]
METIRLDELTARQFSLTPEEATGLIMAGRISINGVPMDKPGTPIPSDAVLILKEKTKKYASRSGYKLEKALEVFEINVSGLTVCDIGASNGGFTDCLLQHGAGHVYAVDVAYGILEWRLRTDERVTPLERTNARSLTLEQLGTRCSLVTADVSFISLSKIFPAVDRVLTADGICICLIKPQFEAPQKVLGKNGVLKDPSILPDLFRSLADDAEQSALYLSGMAVSPIHGTNGDTEFLACFCRQPSLTEEERDRCFEQVAAFYSSEK